MKENSKILFKADISDGKASAFLQLLNEITLLIINEEDQCAVKNIYIIPDGSVEDTVNALYKEDAGSGIEYRIIGSEPRGLVIPFETGNDFYTIVIFTASLVNSITETHFHDKDIVSTVLEELLHVKVYGSIFKKEGFISIKENYIHPDLYKIAAMVHDEFYVNREKTIIAATHNLFEHNGKLVPSRLEFGDNISNILERAIMNVSGIITSALSGSVPVSESWKTSINFIHKGILDPLSRYFAYCSVNEGNSLQKDIEESLIYTEHLKFHWEKIYKILLLSHEKKLHQYSASVKQIVRIITDFLSFLGVDYIKNNSGYRVDFNDRFIKNLHF